MFSTALFLSAVSFAVEPSAEPYDDLKLISQHHYPEQTLAVRQKTITYKSYIRNDGYVPEYYLRESIQVASEISLDYIKNNYKESCDTKDYLELYEVSFRELNVPGYIVSTDQKGFGSIWGYYDPRRSKHGIDAISVTNHTFETTHIIFAHEIAHYWYERLCIGFDWRSTTSEDFAKKIEEIYTSRYVANR